MKNVLRREIAITSNDTFIYDRSMSNALFHKTYELIKKNDIYIHIMKDKKSNCLISQAKSEKHSVSSAAELNVNCIFNYKITVMANSDTTITLYTVINDQLEWLETVEDVYATAQLNKNRAHGFICKFKSIVFVTSERCRLNIKIDPQKIILLNKENYIFNNKRGHSIISVDEIDNISSISRKNGISRRLNKDIDAFEVSIERMKYYLNLSAILTISNSIDNEYKYLPYSIKLNQSSKHRAILKYDIKLSPSAGDFAEITITAIESLSLDTYSIIKDNDKGLIHSKVGCNVKGEFALPIGTLDVGLHIYTPYGFSADIGQDPNTCLAIFNNLSISYIHI